MIQTDQKGLIPAIAQDADTHEVLMLGYMSADSLKRTLETGEVWFYSRSRKELWHKGATSGSYLQVRSITLDCDGDAILLKVKPTGPVCHTGSQTCFFQPLDAGQLQLKESEPSWEALEELFQVILERQRTRPQGSYVARLLEEGIDRIGKKVIEEAGEAVIAAKNGVKSEVAYEVADLWFHSLVMLAALGMQPQDVWDELRRRRK